MHTYSVYTSLNVPTVITSPSANCLQWSADGQACFTSKSAVYIMTPDHGINFDLNSVLKSTVEKDKDGQTSLGWFRTMIQFDKTDACRWPDYSQEWSAISLGSIDISVCAITLSPSNITADVGCILAVLSSNMDLTLWKAGKNGLKSEWVKVFDVTSFLLETFLRDESQSRTAQTIAAQILSISWSSQPDFGVSPTPNWNGSLLVCGSRSGSLIFLRYDGSSQLRIVHIASVATKWVVHVAFSGWNLVQPATCSATVAYATSDGTIGFVKVTQTLQEEETKSPFGLGYSIVTTVEPSQISIESTRKGALTALKWIERSRLSPVLAYSRPGTLYLWSEPSESALWSGEHSFTLRTQKLSVGSSSLYPVSGMQYISRRDALVVCLVDGSFHVVYGLSTLPSLDPPDLDGTLNSQEVSSAVRSVFSRVEEDVIGFADVNRTSGMVSYDDCGAIVWIHEACRPADFSYKHDAKHISMFTVAQVWNDVDDESLLQRASDILFRSKTVSGAAPLHLLRPILFRLRQEKILDRVHEPLLQILSAESADHTLQIALPDWSGELNAETRAEFRGSLARHLFGWDALLSLRMRLSLTDFAGKLLEGDIKAQYGHIAQTLLSTISHRTLRTLIRHLVAASHTCTVDDVPFASRMVVQSRLSGSPADLIAEGQNLAEITRKVGSAQDQLNERCPACQLEVPLEDITSAVCPNGHRWARCSVTTFILSTAHVRTCIGCTRKAFLPLSKFRSAQIEASLPLAVRGSWFVEELLEAVHRCLFCGNSFVSVL